MKKRIVAALLLIVMLGMFVLAGCNQTAGSNGTTPGGNNNGTGNGTGNFTVPETGFDVNTEVTIKFTHTMGADLQGVLNTYIEEFNKIYPNIHIEHLSAGGWSEINGQINTEITGGTQPNIAYCYPDHVAMYNLAKSVVTMDSLINSQIKVGDDIIGLTQEQKDDFITAYYNEGLVYGDGLMYTMPLSKSTEVLYYDKDFFEENNLKVPTTWDEMAEVCARIREIAPDDIPLGYDAEDNWFITLCEQMKTGYTSATGDHYLFDNDENKAFVKMLRDWYNKGYFITKEIYAGAYTSDLFTNQKPNAARSYMCIGSSGGAKYQKSNSGTDDGSFAFEVGVAPIPQYDNNNRKVISQGPSLCILRGADTTDEQIIASWLFIKFLCTSVDFQAEFSMISGYMPVLKSVTENEVYKAWLDEANGYEELAATCVKVGIENRDDCFVSPAFDGSSTARDQVGSLLVKCLLMKEEGDALDDAIDQAFEDAMFECEY